MPQQKKTLHTSQCEFMTFFFPARARELAPKPPEKVKFVALHHLDFTNVVGWFKKLEDQRILPRVQSVVDLFHCKGHLFSGWIKLDAKNVFC